MYAVTTTNPLSFKKIPILYPNTMKNKATAFSLYKPHSIFFGLRAPVCKLSIWCVHNKLLLITTWGVHWFLFCYFWTFREDLIKGYHLWWEMENVWKESVKLQKGRTEDNRRHCPNLVSDPWWGWCWELLLTPLFLSRLSSAKLAPTPILEE